MWVCTNVLGQRGQLNGGASLSSRFNKRWFYSHFIFPGEGLLTSLCGVSLLASWISRGSHASEEGTSGLAHSAVKAGPPPPHLGQIPGAPPGGIQPFSPELQGQSAHFYISVRIVELISINNSKLMFKQIISFIFN